MILAETRRALSPSLFLLCSCLVIASHARSWDLAVIIGNQIDFFARNQTLMGQANIRDAVALTGVTYDDNTRTMYLSDTRNNVSIFSNKLTEKNFTSTPLLMKEDRAYIAGIAFDTSARTLFWVDALKETVAKMYVSANDEPSDPVVLHKLIGSNPRGIALDVCNSRVYWVNSNITNPSIERCNYDGSNRTIVVNDNLYDPLAVTIDHMERKMYWIDDVEGIHFKIERSNLDGSHRELLVHNKHQQPVYLAVDRNTIYWSDWVHSAVWAMPKSAKAGDYPIKFKSYFDSKRDANPAGIVTRDNVGRIDCATIRVVEDNVDSLNASQLLTETFTNLTTSKEESELTTEISLHCLHDGHFNETDGTCKCNLGFYGPFCEVSLCYNYCFSGKCTVTKDGFPKCKCTDTFTGTRCERDVCADYCLNDGECSVQNGKPFCTCTNFTGTRCEKPNGIAEICAIYCRNSESLNSSIIAFCGCTEIERTDAEILRSSDFNCKNILVILISLLAVISGITVILGYYVTKLRKRPRIRRRFVVSRSGVTPLTSRPGGADSEVPCEIMIENCCNMNVCETPCFEPNVRTGKSSSPKREDKNPLLDDTEGDLC